MMMIHDDKLFTRIIRKNDDDDDDDDAPEFSVPGTESDKAHRVPHSHCMSDSFIGICSGDLQPVGFGLSAKNRPFGDLKALIQIVERQLTYPSTIR